ncbi:Short-chain dehydrogenase [Rubellimicrobium thermophilum DSM 16684]|uniref:Short-chain dehydrogenase n=1 Tax=Rubellimicrobium thermophilum DSM 16684 TaxID=1123069 RepID=S9R1W4_9RHOB|nr:SDR family oxidoreductase [Rubellimicrobium thermophilum]EPX87631.1 Short-chain dehydrogenase [Rubellimicrobium thermophilum DSM 16684]
MDLGIRGRRAMVTGASRGLGRGCAEALAAEGVDLVIAARGREPLEETAAAIRARHGVAVTAVIADVTTDAGRAALREAAGELDILVTNAGGPPPGRWEDFGPEALQRALEASMLAPIALMRDHLPGMIARGWGRVVNITSSAVVAPTRALGLSTAARMGLTGWVANTAREVAGQGVTINNLLPGSHETDRIRRLDQDAAEREGLTPEAVRARALARIPAGRYGDPAAFGAVCAFLCSEQAGYIVGQNILVDGGAVARTL